MDTITIYVMIDPIIIIATICNIFLFTTVGLVLSILLRYGPENLRDKAPTLIWNIILIILWVASGISMLMWKDYLSKLFA